MSRHEPRILALAAVCLAVPAFAQPVPEAERIPVDIRRTTLLVRDIDRSLAFWRDGLGLTVIYDRVLGEPPRTTRLVLLRANDRFIGNLGLMRRSTDPIDVPVTYERATTGQVILVVNATDQEERLERLRRVPGVKISSEPVRIEYPAPDGKGTIPVMVTYLWDPDGYFVEVNKILGTPAGVKPEPPAEVSPEAEAVVRRMLEATGGASRWAAMKTRMMRAHLETGKGVLYEVTTWLKGSAYRRDVLMEGRTSTPIATDGVAGWSLESGAGPLDLTGPRLEAAAESRDKELPFLDVAGKKFKLQAPGLERVDGREFTKLTLTLRSGAVRVGLIDPGTGLLDREILRTRGRDGIESVVDQRYSDYRTVAGYKVPFRIARFDPAGNLRAAPLPLISPDRIDSGSGFR